MHNLAIKLPSLDEAEQAQNVLRLLSQPEPASNRVLQVAEGPDSAIAIALPRKALDLLVEILAHLANGTAVSILPIQAELTTQQAAELLNVPRPFLLTLLESGKLPYRMVGVHRRVLVEHLAQYAEKEAERSKAILDELTAEAEEMGFWD